MNSNINAIIFDLGGVILNIDYNKTIESFKKIGVTDFDKLYTQAQQNHIFDKFETGKITPQDFRDYIKTIAKVNLTNKQIDNAWNAMLLDLPEHRIDVLKRISKSHQIYLYSNTNAIHLKSFRNSIEKEHGNKFLLEEIFLNTYYSHEIGMRKPNQNGFLHILNENNLNPANTLFIDDSKQHIEGAKQLGLQTVWLYEKDITEIF